MRAGGVSDQVLNRPEPQTSPHAYPTTAFAAPDRAHTAAIVKLSRQWRIGTRPGYIEVGGGIRERCRPGGGRPCPSTIVTLF